MKLVNLLPSAAAWILVTSLVLGTPGCKRRKEAPQQDPLVPKQKLMVTRIPLYSNKWDLCVDIMTVDHDGHRFIVSTVREAVGLLHHPSCPCLTKPQ